MLCGHWELAADADLCGTCLNDWLTTCIMAGVASEDLRKMLLAINPFPRLDDVVARCRSEESATNTEAEFTRRALTSAVLSAPRTTPSTSLRRHPALSPPATKRVCRFCGGRPHQTRSECPAYGTKCTASTGCIIFLISANLGTTRFPHNLKTQCPRTRLMSTFAPLPQLTTLSLFIKMLDIAISCICATSSTTVVTPLSNLIGQASLCPHSPSTPKSGSKIHIQRAGTRVAPSSGSEHASRIVCSCPVDVDGGTNAVPFALCRIFQNRRSAVDSDNSFLFLSLSLSLSLFFFFRPHSLSVWREGEMIHTVQCSAYDIRGVTGPICSGCATDTELEFLAEFAQISGQNFA